MLSSLRLPKLCKHSGSIVKLHRSMAVLCVVLLCSGVNVVGAADTTVGGGSGVAYGTGSNAPRVGNVAVGENAKILYSNGNGSSAATGDIVIGDKAHTNNYVNQGGGIAIGAGAFQRIWQVHRSEGLILIRQLLQVPDF